MAKRSFPTDNVPSETDHPAKKTIAELERELADARRSNAEHMAKLSKTVHAKCAEYASKLIECMIKGALCRGQTLLDANTIRATLLQQVFEHRPHYDSPLQCGEYATLCEYLIRVGDEEEFLVRVCWSNTHNTRFELTYSSSKHDSVSYKHDYGKDVVCGATFWPPSSIIDLAVSKKLPLACALRYAPATHRVLMRIAIAVLWCDYGEALTDIEGADAIAHSGAYSRMLGKKTQVILNPCKHAHTLATQQTVVVQHVALCDICTRSTAHFNPRNYNVMTSSSFLSASERTPVRELLSRDDMLCCCVSVYEQAQPEPLAFNNSPDKRWNAMAACHLIGDLIQYMPGYATVTRSWLAQAE